MNAVAMTKAYEAWQTAHRERWCDIEACGPPPNPSQPPDCLFEVSCKDGTCDNECDW